MDETARLFRRTATGFVNVAPINGDTLKEIDEMVSIEHVTIHIFDVAFMWIENVLERIFSKCKEHNCTTTIYVPESMNDYVKWFYGLYGGYGDVMVVNLVSEPVEFTTEDGNKLTITSFTQNSDYVMTWDIGGDIVFNQTLTGRYYKHRNDRVYANILMSRYPDIFRDELIERFRNLVPEWLKEVFNTDDVIWDYMMRELKSGGEDNEDIAED